MEGGAIRSAQEAPGRRAYRSGLFTLGIAAVLFVGLGLWLAALTNGAARLWTGPGLIVGLGLALVVGASKTSSA